VAALHKLGTSLVSEGEEMVGEMRVDCPTSGGEGHRPCTEFACVLAGQIYNLFSKVC
jgi:hypothetical protein